MNCKKKPENYPTLKFICISPEKMHLQKKFLWTLTSLDRIIGNVLSAFETSSKRLREVAIFSYAHISTQSYKAHKKIKKHNQNEQNKSPEHSMLYMSPFVLKMCL